MSDARRESFFRWLPVLVALGGFIGNAIWAGRWSGAVEQRLVALESHQHDAVVHMPLEKKIDIFVTRQEFSGVTALRNIEVADMKRFYREEFSSVNSKLDRLIERVSLSKN